LAQEGIAAEDLVLLQRDHAHAVFFWITQAINGGDRCHDDHILAREQAGGGCQAQALDLLVDVGLLLDVKVALGDVGFRLVVIVIGDEVLHRVVGEELPELGIELGSQGLVVRHHQRGDLELLNDIRHSEGLAGAGGAQQHLVLEALLDAFDQLADGFRLVAGGFIGGMQVKFHEHYYNRSL